MDISDSIKRVSFYSLEQFDCSKIVGFTSETDKWYHSLKCGRILKEILSRIFLNRLEYEVKESKGDKIILFAYNELWCVRRDVYDMMLKIYSCSENATFVQVKVVFKINSLSIALRRVSLAIRWYYQMRKTDLGLVQKFGVIGDLLTALAQCERISPFIEFKCLVVRYDAFIDNPISQLFKINGRTTITAQHGLMSSTRDEAFYGIWFRNSVSDYFMAWDLLTKLEAAKDGLSSNSVIICGNAKCIDSINCINPKNGVFGVLLDGYDFINRGLISIANGFCKKHGYKYILRYHPNYKGNEYDTIVDDNFYIVSDRNSLSDYSNSVEFTLIGNSTALLELVYMNHPSFVFSTNSGKELYSDYIPVCHNLAEFESLLEDPEYMMNVSNILVTIKNARDGYSNFFKRINTEIANSN